MRFSDWIEESGLKTGVIADRLDMARTRLWRLTNGKAEPTLEEVYNISILTEYKVTFNDFLEQAREK